MPTSNPSLDQDYLWPPHVTVASVIADGDRFLLVKERHQGKIVYNQREFGILSACSHI